VATTLPTPEEQNRSAVGAGLRNAVACTICLAVTELWHLEMGFMSLISAHLIITQYTYSAFQKGVERIAGRVGAVVYGLGLVVFFRDSPAVYLALLVVEQLAVYYVYASGRLSYVALQMGAFTAILAATGMTSTPDAVVPLARDMILQIVLGVSVANLVNWVSGAERTLAIQTGEGRLLPLRPDWFSQGGKITCSTLLAIFTALYWNLPPLSTVVSAVILGGTHALPELWAKGAQRGLAPVIAFGYGLAAVVTLAHVPRLPLLFLFTFLVQFASAYYTKASTRYSYAALQTGLAAPMVLIGSPGQLADLDAAIQRLVGVVAGFLATLVVQALWPEVPPPAPPQ
jgi:uncharacterized membrane protein YccC